MPAKRSVSPSVGTSSSPAKKARRKTSPSSSPETTATLGQEGSKWRDWPAPYEQITAAREFFRECARDPSWCFILPDKDADGLSSCMIAWKTLTTLGVPADKIRVQFLEKGASLFGQSQQDRIEALIRETCQPPAEATASTSSQKAEPAKQSARVIILDQGSRPGPPLIRKDQVGIPDLKTLIVDHHQSTEWPEQATILTACHSPPISTSSLLTYLTCAPLHPDIAKSTMWYCLLGVFGDLSPNEIKWGDSKGVWPVTREMTEIGEEMKRIGKKPLSSAVSAINARELRVPARKIESQLMAKATSARRTAVYNVEDAWKVLFKAKTPEEIARSGVLQDARDAVNMEVERCTHTAPKFSKDGRVALLRINSGYQVHPVIATRWSGTLKGAKKLQMIMVENPGHNPDPEMTSFSCRLASQFRRLPEEERPSLIDLLKEYGELTGDGFLERVGNDFARGHREATGGIIKKTDFEAFAEKGMEIGVKDPNARPTKKELKAKAVQSNTLKSYFSTSPKKEAAKEESIGVE